MRIPTAPPDDTAAFARAMQDTKVGFKLFSVPPEQGESYLHWDDLRRRPVPEGLDHEAWWAIVKLRRKASGQTLPFSDTAKRSFWFTEPAAIREAVRNVDLHWGGVIGSPASGIATPGEARTYLVRSLAEEPFSSSFLEGAATSREIAKQLIFQNRAPRTVDERMVLNNYYGLNYVKSNISGPLTVKIILETHRIITKGTLERPEMAGVMRADENDVHVVDNSTGEILHTPPRAEELPQRLQLICDFANNTMSDTGFMHPVVRAIVTHFMLAYDHPFVDGNGRTARALFYWLMLKSGYWLAEYASISSAINKAPVKYGRAFLETETDGADMTYFIMHQCLVIAEAERGLRQYIERKRKEIDNLAFVIEATRRDGGFNHRQTAILNEFIRKRSASTTIANYQIRHSVSYHTARNDLEELVIRGYLSKRRDGRESYYTPISTLERKLLGGVKASEPAVGR